MSVHNGDTYLRETSVLSKKKRNEVGKQKFDSFSMVLMKVTILDHIYSFQFLILFHHVTL